MSGDAHKAFGFANYTVDIGNRELLCDGVPVQITPKCLAVLALLVESAPRLVRKEEFLCKIWNNETVGDASLTQKISELRKILELSETDRFYIQTVWC